MPYNPYNQPLLSRTALRESKHEFEDLLKILTPAQKQQLFQHETFEKYREFREANPKMELPYLLPKHFEIKLAAQLYDVNYPRGRIDEWEEEKREQEEKQWEGKKREAEEREQKHAYHQAAYRTDQALDALGIAALPVVSYFALADTMQDDRRYKKIVKNLDDVKNWQKQNPKEPLYKKITLPDGRKVKVLNPLLKQAVFDVHDQAEQAFEKKHPFWAKRYREKERRRVYNNLTADPSYNKLRKSIDQKNLQAFQSYAPGQAGAATQLQQMTKLIREKEYQDWVRDHPEKAKAYSQYDPHMKQAFDQYQREKKQNRLSRRLFRKITGRKAPTAPLPKKRSIKQIIRDEYDDKKKKLKQLARQYAARQGKRVAWQATKSAARGSWRAVSRSGPAIRGGGRATIRAGGGLVKAALKFVVNFAGRLIISSLRAALMNPYTAVAIALIIALILLYFLIISIFFGKGGEGTDGQVTVTKSLQAGDDVVDNPPSPDVGTSDIHYTISASYGGTATDIIITDTIDKNAKFVSATGNYSFDGTTVTWHTNQQGITPTPTGPTTTPAPSGTTPAPTTPPTSAGSASSGTFTLVIRPINPDIYIVNQAFAQVIGGSGTGTGPAPTGSGSGTTPNKDTCNGTYNLSSGETNGTNWGDPDCNLANSPRVPYSFGGKSWNVPQALLDRLNQLDPSNTGYWVGIASCEAPGFNPNNWTASPDPTQLDPCGAWGLFQMGSNEPSWGDCSNPYAIPGAGLNGPYDRGDVYWTDQVSNAVTYRNNAGGAWNYWGCARSVWGLW